MKTLNILSTDKKIYSSNEEIKVSYSNMPDLKPDSAYHLINIVKKNSDEKLRWLPILREADSGSRIFSLAEPGEYEIQLIYNYGFEGCNYPTAYSKRIKVA